MKSLYILVCFSIFFAQSLFAATGFFEGKDGVRIAYQVSEVENEKAAVVIVSGRTEPYAKYEELITDFHRMGYSVYIMDHRGQGLSGRMLPNPQIGYVKDFSDYVVDLKKFVDTIVNAKPHAHRYLFAHSMGGAIALLYAQENPDAFEAAVLSAPMLSIKTEPFSEAAAYSAAYAAWVEGVDKEYAFKQHDYAPRGVFEGNHSSHSEQRYTMMLNLFKNQPEATLGGMSYHWLKTSIDATRDLQKLAPTITIPILLMQAGEDVMVNPEGQKKFCDKAPNCRLKIFTDSFHEIFQEKDSIRNEALIDLKDFFTNRMEPGALPF